MTFSIDAPPSPSPRPWTTVTFPLRRQSKNSFGSKRSVVVGERHYNYDGGGGGGGGYARVSPTLRKEMAGAVQQSLNLTRKIPEDIWNLFADPNIVYLQH